MTLPSISSPIAHGSTVHEASSRREDPFAAAFGSGRGSGRSIFSLDDVLADFLTGRSAGNGELVTRGVEVAPLAGGGTVRVSVLLDTHGQLLAHFTERNPSRAFALLTVRNSDYRSQLLTLAHAAGILAKKTPKSHQALLTQLSVAGDQRRALEELEVASRAELLVLAVKTLTDKHRLCLRELSDCEGEGIHAIGKTPHGTHSISGLLSRGLVHYNRDSSQGPLVWLTDAGRAALALL